MANALFQRFWFACVALAVIGCLRSTDSSGRLGRAGESCTKAADCESGLMCIGLVCLVSLSDAQVDMQYDSVFDSDTTLDIAREDDYKTPPGDAEETQRDIGDAFSDTVTLDAANPDALAQDTEAPDTVTDGDLLETGPDACQPECGGRTCGDNGCGGDCGTCTGAQDLCVDGACQCQPACDDKVCGDDGCGATCGDCQQHFGCEAGACVFQPWCGDGTCTPEGLENCTSCPGDCTCGCGEICGAGACVFTVCEGKNCGDNGCGGTCGTCNDGMTCQDGVCVLVGCQDVTELGVCEGNILKYCSNGQLKVYDCSDYGKACAWDADNGWYDCLG